VGLSAKIVRRCSDSFILRASNRFAMNKFRSGWYLIYTRPQHERKVQSQLDTLKIKSFLPLTRKLRTLHDRKKYVEQPLFPSYVFVYLEDLQNYYAGMESDGTLYYVKTGKDVARVQESVVENLKLAANRDFDLEVACERFRPGQAVVITQPPLTGLSCEIVQYNNKQRLMVKVELLNRSILITVPESYLMTS
jgi:transcriptional antiterminator RfaH